nr:unnamed protein product [Callosobruchus chinensis]
MDAKLLKSRIKSIKDSYRQELQKIEKSKKSGCGTDQIYKPKLSWFTDATYLSEVVTTRSSTSNLPPEPPKKRVRKHLDNRKSDNEDISQAIKQLDCIANNAAMDKPYDLFGRYVASELRQLPKREAILLQQNIQNSITQAKLEMLDKPSVHQELVDIPLLSHESTATDSSNDLRGHITISPH